MFDTVRDDKRGASETLRTMLRPAPHHNVMIHNIVDFRFQSCPEGRSYLSK